MTLSTSLKLFTWNVRGAMSSALCISDMLDKLDADIAVLCEHKLSNENLPFLNSLHGSYMAFPNSCQPNLAGNSHVAVMVRRSMMYSVTYLETCELDRVIGIEVKAATSTPIFIFGVYLPFDTDIQSYKRYIEYMYDLWSYYSELGSVIFLGDFKVRFDENPVTYSSKRKLSCSRFRQTEQPNTN